MIISNIGEYKNGWFIGDFEPSIFKETTPHTHKVTTELNYILKGKLHVSGNILKSGDIWIYEKNEISDVQFLEDSELMVIRWPSIPTDKYIV
jgi:quercetin dioxygenase-like cupin family protein